MSNQLFSGQGRDINLPAGQSLAVSSITGAYTATIIAGAGTGTALATASTGGGTYGPYAAGVTIRLVAAEGGLIDYDAAVTPALSYSMAVQEGVIPFSASVPLTGRQLLMETETVTGAIAFTVASGAVSGASATVDLVADGVNTPTFAGMFPTNGSAAYLNVAGAINSLSFYRANDVTWYSITNNAAAYSETYAVAVTPTALEYMTDSGGGVYTATSSGTSNGAKMVIDRYLPANTNGSLIGTFDTGGDVAFTLGLDTSSSVALLEGNSDFSIRVSLAGLLSAGTNGAPVSTGITIAAASTTRLRLRRADGVVTAEYSYDSGATWTVAYTWAGSSTALLNAHYYTTYSTTGKRLVAPKTAGLVPA